MHHCLFKSLEVAITKAFDLNAKYIIHVSSPWWQGGDKNEDECLRLCYQRALQLAKRHRCKSIAFPVLATGTYGFPKELGIQIAVDTFTDFLENNDIEITLVVFGSEDVSISGKLVEEVASYIDDSYVETAIAKEYQNDIGSCERGNRSKRREEAVFQPMLLPSYCEEEKEDEIKSIHDDFNEENETESSGICSSEHLQAVFFQIIERKSKAVKGKNAGTCGRTTPKFG